MSVPSSPLAPFTPAQLASLAVETTTSASAEPQLFTGADESPLAPMAPVATPLPGAAGGGGSSNWTSNVQANGFDLQGVGDLSVDGSIFLGTGTTHAAIDGDPSGDMQITSPAQLAISALTMQINAPLTIDTTGKFVLNQLPTSATGLTSGEVWNNGGVLNIVP